jgi:hypothetical protein
MPIVKEVTSLEECGIEANKQVHLAAQCDRLLLFIIPYLPAFHFHSLLTLQWLVRLCQPILLISPCYISRPMAANLPRAAWERWELYPHRPLLRDVVMNGRPRKPDSTLLRLPTEVSAHIVDLLSDRKASFASLDLVSRDS